MAECIMGQLRAGSLYALCLRESSRRTTAHTNFNGSLHDKRFVAGGGRKGAGKPAPFDPDTHKASNTALLRHAVIVQSFG